MVQISFYHWQVAESPRPEAATLAGDQIQVWIATIPTRDSDLEELKDILSLDECQRAEGFKARDPRRQFICSRFVLRHILGGCWQVAPTSLVFGFRPAGKPYLLPLGLKPDLRFNLSHSADMVAVAVARGFEVGIDVEWIHGLQDWAPLESRVLSLREAAGLRALPPAQHRQAFFNGWTRKEAWLKATGQGLIDDLPAIEATLAPDEIAKWICLPGGDEVVRQWSLCNLELPPEYAGALVFQNQLANSRLGQDPN